MMPAGTASRRDMEPQSPHSTAPQLPSHRMAAVGGAGTINRSSLHKGSFAFSSCFLFRAATNRHQQRSIFAILPPQQLRPSHGAPAESPLIPGTLSSVCTNGPCLTVPLGTVPWRSQGRIISGESVLRPRGRPWWLQEYTMAFSGQQWSGPAWAGGGFGSASCHGPSVPRQPCGSVVGEGRRLHGRQ